MSIMYQIGLVPAFLNGIYVSNYTFKTLAKQGDFGLGTINELNGEMIALDGKFYCIDKNGVTREIKKTECTPFSVVSFFKPSEFKEISHIQNIQQLNQTLLSMIKNVNLFYMFRIDGEFSSMQLRSETCHCSQVIPLSELLLKHQNKYQLRKTHGSLVVTYSPSYSKQMCIESFHYHYINDERSTGGHVFDLVVEQARVSLQAIENFQMNLVNLTQLANTDLSINSSNELKKIE
jgi:acetolactate decarboxylase